MAEIIVEPTEFRFRITYSRREVGAFLSHLDATNTMIRAIRRSRLPYKISTGFHLRPKVSFGPPLPLGHSSSCEIIDLSLTREMVASEVFSRLDAQMPSGFRIVSVRLLEARERSTPSEGSVRYRFRLRDSAADVKRIMIEFLSEPDREIEVKKGDTIQRFKLGDNVHLLEPLDGPSSTEMIAEFQQGKPGQASASKVIQALVDFLGEKKEALLDVERIALGA